MFYFVPTPIGNLEDVTLRALRVLKECAAVYCEDTRRTGQLLRHFSIEKPLLSCHAHNEAARAAEIAARLGEGETLCYASDAGMPCISDPGSRIARHLAEAGLPFSVLPGPSASLTALALSGMDAADACFVGFLPRKGKARRERLEALAAHPGPLILYESPLRLADTCAQLAARFGEREAVLCRELSKLHEERLALPLSQMAERFAGAPPRGECVLVIAPPAADAAQGETADAAAETLLRGLLASGLSAKDAAKQAAAQTGGKRNALYAMALALREDKGEGSGQQTGI